MAAVAHNPAFAKRVGIKQSVGKEFVAADKGKKFRSGGRPDLQKINRPKTEHGRMALFKEGGTMKVEKKVAPSKMGAVKTAAPSRDGLAVKGKTKGKQIKMSGGGMTKKGGKC